MKKASEILTIIGVVFAIFSAIGLLIGAIVLYTFASPASTQPLIDAIADGTIKTDIPGAAEEIVAVLQLGFGIGGTACVVAILFEIALVVVALFAKSKQTSGLYIASLVLSVLGGSILILIASILGLVGNSEEKQTA